MKPYFTLSKRVALSQHKSLLDVADLISYSSKTNPLITPILEENTDCLFSIHLTNELKNVKDMERVLFLSQAWTKNQIKFLLQKGINKFVVDNEVDLKILLSFLETYDGKIDLMLRIKLKENTVKTEKYFVFGMNIEAVKKYVLELKDNHKIGSLGIHFHRKTQNVAEWNLTYELQDLFNDEELAAIDVVNIGGGLPSDYANTNKKVIESIFRRIAEAKTFLNSKNIKLMVEPGRYIAAPSGKLHTEILSIYENNIIVNVSVYNSDMDALIVPVKLLVEGELERGEGEAYVLKGITPCSLDLFRYRVYLKDPKVGDELVFLNAGAYNFTTDFVDLEKIETKAIE